MKRDNKGAQRVWEILQNHKGEAHAISQYALAIETGLRPRSARGLVKRLIEEDHRVICSSYHGGGGYFIPNTAEEIAKTRKVLRAHALSILKRYAAMDGDINELQMELFGGQS